MSHPPSAPNEPQPPNDPQPPDGHPATADGPPPVPHQPAPADDGPTAAVFTPGSAPVPSQPPAEPTVPMPLGAPPPPTYGGPYAGAPVAGEPAASRPSRRGLVVLAVLAVVFFLVAGLMGGLYIGKTGELNQTRKDLGAQVSRHETTIADQKAQIDQLKLDLQSAKDEVERVRQDLTGTQNAADELRRQKGVISRCLNLLAEAGFLAEQGRTSQARTKLNEATPVCDEAERYLD